MKLRLDKRSITIRIEHEERHKLLQSGKLFEQVTIGANNLFQFVVEISVESDSTTASFNHSALLIQIPENLALQWLSSNQIGIREKISNNEGDEINLVIEEDLPPRKKHTIS